jgi:hypothetical protein
MHLLTRLICLVALTLPVYAGAVSMGEQQEFDLFLQWFEGEYDNHEQVWQQKENGVAEEDLLEHIHHRFVSVEAPALGEHVFFVLQTMDDDLDKVYRQRLYVFDRDEQEDAIRLIIYRMADEAKYRDSWRQPELVRDITMEEVSTLPGCEVYWRHNGEFFDGYMKDKACHFFSKRSGKEIYITDTLRLTDSEIWISDKAFDAEGNHIFGRDEPHKNRKVRKFKAWMGVKKNRVNPDYEGDDMFFNGDIQIHNEGQIVNLLDDDGKPTGYSIELAQLTYQNTTTPILKLGVIEDATGKTLVYTWGATDASRIGINVRWFQAGLTAIED